MTNLEEKYKYFFNNGTLNFSIDIAKFEEILHSFTQTYQHIPSFKNGYKLYGINNKFFKIFEDGSCYGYIIIDNSIKTSILENFTEYKQINQQIYNDDFAGFKDYWVEEIYEDIIFKLDDDMQLIFSKMKDVPRNITEYSIYIETKKNNPSLIDPIKHIISNI